MSYGVAFRGSHGGGSSSYGHPGQIPVRPIVTLESSIKLTKGDAD